MKTQVTAIIRSIRKNKTYNFLNLFGLAIGIACAAMHNWLQGYAYRITIEWWVFALAGLLAILIAVLTVSFQAIKAALANPVKSLRTE